MKQIEVSEEMYDFLSNLSKEIKSQDNRATAMPYFYQIQEDDEVCVPDGCGEEVWVCDGLVLRTDDDIKNAIFEWKEWELGNEKHENAFREYDRFDIENILEENYRKVNVDIKHKYSNCFLTFKAYEDHIRQNRHNLCNPKSYLFHAFRNKEMEMLFKFLQSSF